MAERYYVSLDRFKDIAKALSPKAREDVDKLIAEITADHRKVEEIGRKIQLGQIVMSEEADSEFQQSIQAIQAFPLKVAQIAGHLGGLKALANAKGPERKYSPFEFRKNLSNLFEACQDAITITGDASLAREIARIEKLIMPGYAMEKIPQSKAIELVNKLIELLVPKILTMAASFVKGKIDDMAVTLKASHHKVEGYREEDAPRRMKKRH